MKVCVKGEFDVTREAARRMKFRLEDDDGDVTAAAARIRESTFRGRVEIRKGHERGTWGNTDRCVPLNENLKSSLIHTYTRKLFYLHAKRELQNAH